MEHANRVATSALLSLELFCQVTASKVAGLVMQVWIIALYFST